MLLYLTARRPSWNTEPSALPVKVTVWLSPLTTVVMPLLCSRVTIEALMDSLSAAPTGASASPLRRLTVTSWMLPSRSVMLASGAAMASGAPFSV